MTCLMGIDPGLQGSIVALNERVVSVHRMPLLEGKRARLDVHRLAQILRLGSLDLQLGPDPRYYQSPDLITIEQAQAMPKQGVVSSFNYGTTYGTLLALLTLSGHPHRVVSPQVWKRQFGLAGNTKVAAIEVALRRIPMLREALYDGEGKPLYPKEIRVSMCEAALLALSGKLESPKGSG